MQRKDILELRKRLKKDECTFTNLSGCYVNDEKEVVSKFSEFFLTLEEDELFKYLDIAKKAMSGTLGNNILKLKFPLDDDFKNERQGALLDLKNSRLKNEDLLDEFYELVIDSYDYEGNFLILLFHDAYDIMTKTKDNIKLDDSEEVYEYILCALCPVDLSEPGLTYIEEEDVIKSRIRDWVVERPLNGFAYPAFVDRSSDVNSVMYYTRKPKEPHPELMESVLGCHPRQTATLQKEVFESVIKTSLDVEEEQAKLIFMDVQDNLNTMIEEYNTLYEDVEHDPITLSKNHMKDLLNQSGIPDESSELIESTYSDSFSDELPLASSLIDKKVLKESAQVEKERNLIKQVGDLQVKYDELSQHTVLDTDDENLIQLHVSPNKVSQIKSQTIDGQKYLMIPIGEDEQTKVNGQSF